LFPVRELLFPELLYVEVLGVITLLLDLVVPDEFGLEEYLLELREDVLYLGVALVLLLVL
tara:strand:+ start:626 stop:805 length:180 start_codon:yes stop_codon:yes gene_type:complete